MSDAAKPKPGEASDARVEGNTESSAPQPRTEADIPEEDDPAVEDTERQPT